MCFPWSNFQKYFASIGYLGMPEIATRLCLQVHAPPRVQSEKFISSQKSTKLPSRGVGGPQFHAEQSVQCIENFNLKNTAMNPEFLEYLLFQLYFRFKILVKEPKTLKIYHILHGSLSRVLCKVIYIF